MNTEAFNNIDLLIEMTDSNFNIDEINSELISLKRLIRNKKSEIDDLKSIMNDARYFNASNELVDKNIEISLKNKINRLKRKIRDLTLELDETKQEESKLHEDLNSLKNKISKNEKYVTILAKKSEDTKSNKYYNNLLKDEEKNVANLNKELDKKEKNYEEVLKKLDLTNLALLEMNEKLENESHRLDDIIDSLNNPSSYHDEDLKQEDEDKLEALNSELEKLEKRRIELLTDAKMIGTDAKQLIIDNNYGGALAKIKELVTIVKSVPYMDVTNKSILDEELEKKENERIELSNLIDNKNYEGIGSNAIINRIDYLNKEIENIDNEITKHHSEVTSIDDFINETLGDMIKSLEVEVAEKEHILEEYHSMLKDKETSLRTKSNLESALVKKEKEKKILDGLLSSYKEDLLSKIAKTNELNDIINNLEENLEKYKLERDNLNKLTMLELNTKDVLEEEKDKEDLRKINEDIKAIKNRQKYDKSPDEIYDQIEMCLASNFNSQIKPKESEEVEKLEPVEQIDNLFSEKIPDKVKVVDMIPIETLKPTDEGAI